MSIRTLLVAAAAALALAGAGATPAFAQAKPTVIAFVDVPRVLKDSAAAKSARDQLTKQQQAYEAEIKSQEDKLRAEDQEIQKQRSVLSPDALQKRAREFQTKVEAARQQFERRRTQLAFAQDDAMRQMQPVFQKICGDVAKEVGASVVLDSSRVLVSASSLNITDQVLQRLDKQLPSLKLNFNAPQSAAPAAAPAPSASAAPSAIAPAPAPAPAAPASGGINLNP